MQRSIELSETLEKALSAYTVDRINGDHEVTDKDLQDSFDLIITKALEGVIEHKYRQSTREKTLEEKAAVL